MDSLQISLLAICLLAAVCGYAFSRARRWWLGLLGSLLAPVLIAYVWFWLFQLTGLFFDEPIGPVGPWDMIFAAVWSLYAVPTAILVFLAARLLRAKRTKAA